MQIGQFLLELHQRMMRARDIAGAAGAGADAGRGLDHGAHHLRVLAHAEIIVGAPDHDVARAFRRMPHRMRETAGDAFEVGEDAVTPLVMQATKGGVEELAVIHRKTWSGELGPSWSYTVLERFQVYCRAEIGRHVGLAGAVGLHELRITP